MEWGERTSAPTSALELPSFFIIHESEETEGVLSHTRILHYWRGCVLEDSGVCWRILATLLVEGTERCDPDPARVRFSQRCMC